MLGLGIDTRRSARWWPEDAVYAADFVNNRYMRNGVEIARSAALTFTRNSPRLAQDSTGIWRSFGPNEPAITDLGLSLEPAANNMVPNSALAGAALGVIGAGGSLPTGWLREGYDTVTVTALGTEIGLPFIELRLQARNTGSTTRYPLIRITPTPIPALLGETWTASAFFRKTGGNWHPNPANNLAVTVAEVGTTTTYPVGTIPIDGQANFSRVSQTWITTRPGTITLIARILQTTLDVGDELDLSIRIAAPMLGRTSSISSPTISSGATAERPDDQMTLHVPTAASTFTAWRASTALYTLSSSSSVILQATGAIITHITAT